MRRRSLLALAFLPAVAYGQRPDSTAAAAIRDSVLRANSHRGTFSSGELKGGAATFLLREAGSSQFVLIGERHDIKEIPEIAGWLLDRLHRESGFNHLATENGAIVTDLAFQGSRASSVDSILAYATRYPNAFEFGSDQDLTLVGRARSTLSTSGKSVWGLDQEFGASNLLDRLRKLPAPPAARHAVDSLYALASTAEHLRFDAGGIHWLAEQTSPTTFRDVLRLYGPKPDAEARRILEQLQESSRLYDLNRRGSKGEPVGFTANDDREQLMRRNFVRDYDEAVAHGEKRPRVFVKMGQAHAGRGQSPFGPFSVGDLIYNMATANGTRSFHVAILAHNSKADSTAPSLWQWADMRPLADATPVDGITVIDLRPIRPLLYSRRLDPVGADLRRVIYAFDAIVLVGGAHNATYDLTRRAPH